MSKETDTVLQKIKSGFFKLSQPKGKTSGLWKCSDIIQNSSDNSSAGYVYCKQCKTVLKYNPAYGTSTMSRHKCSQETVIFYC